MKTTKAPRLSGYCNPSYRLTVPAGQYNPHTRCTSSTCECSCHQTPASEVEDAPVWTRDEPTRSPATTSGAEPRCVSSDVAFDVADHHSAPELHGFYDDMDEALYHRHPTSLSQSGAKLILQAPALFQWHREYPVRKAAFDFGSAAHALVLGKGMDQIYVAPFDDWTRRKGPEGGTQYTTDERRIAEADGLSPILHKDWLVICDMAEKLATHKQASDLLAEGEAEISAFCRDKATGVLRRGRFDVLGPRRGVDYKSSVSADPDHFSKAALDYGYHQQDAWYCDLAQDLDRPLDEFLFVLQMKDPPYLVTVCELDQRARDRGRELNRRALERFRDCEAAGVWPAYIPDDEIAVISLPPWAFYDNEES